MSIKIIKNEIESLLWQAYEMGWSHSSLGKTLSKKEKTKQFEDWLKQCIR